MISNIEMDFEIEPSASPYSTKGWNKIQHIELLVLSKQNSDLIIIRTLSNNNCSKIYF